MMRGLIKLSALCSIRLGAQWSARHPARRFRGLVAQRAVSQVLGQGLEH